jgi:hypothetical protein
MSEVQPRPATRGRSSARGRGGFRGAPRSSKHTNGDSNPTVVDTSADEGELGALKRQYKSQLTTLKEMFPDWTDADLVLGINDCNGDIETTIDRIAEGMFKLYASRADDEVRKSLLTYQIPTRHDFPIL